MKKKKKNKKRGKIKVGLFFIGKSWSVYSEIITQIDGAIRQGMTSFGIFLARKILSMYILNQNIKCMVLLNKLLLYILGKTENNLALRNLLNYCKYVFTARLCNLENQEMIDFYDPL